MVPIKFALAAALLLPLMLVNYRLCFVVDLRFQELQRLAELDRHCLPYLCLGCCRCKGWRILHRTVEALCLLVHQLLAVPVLLLLMQLVQSVLLWSELLSFHFLPQ